MTKKGLAVVAVSLGGILVLAACTGDLKNGAASSESSALDEGECDAGEIIIPYVDPEPVDAGGVEPTTPPTTPPPTPDAGDPDDDDDDAEDTDAGMDAGGLVEVDSGVTPMDAAIFPADRPRPPPTPPKPPVCKPKKTNCNAPDEALKPECRGGKKDQLYKQQKLKCGLERACDEKTSCTDVARNIERNKTCKDLRVAVRDCYIVKCQAGHVVAITEALIALSKCQGEWERRCKNPTPAVDAGR